MKRYLFAIVAVLFSTIGVKAMSYEEAREQAYYLTDKMAYELNLNDQQYNDAYEINLDYLLSLNTEADLYGTYLDYRNADLRYILYDWQWSVFAAADYFYRPVWWYNGGWLFPIYNHYVRGYYWFDRPGCFWDYRGAHGRGHFMDRSFYADRRPGWNGGMRGRGRDMVGSPTGRSGGRYGGNSMERGTMNQGRGTMNQRMNGTRGNMNQGRGTNMGTTRGNMQNSTGRGTMNQMNSRSNSTYNRGNMGNANQRGTLNNSDSRGSMQQSSGMRSSSRSSLNVGSQNRSSMGSMSGRTSSNMSGGRGSFGGGTSMGGSNRGSAMGGGNIGGGSRGGGASMGGGARGGRR